MRVSRAMLQDMTFILQITMVAGTASPVIRGEGMQTCPKPGPAHPEPE